MSPTTNSTSSPASATTAAAIANDPLASESTFLTLLVSQLQNQDPLNPIDSTTFVSQLTSYSQLEQLINIDHNTTPAAPASTDGTTPASTSKTEI
jgi:flagellar basal-body rod modification protein FlgD